MSCLGTIGLIVVIGAHLGFVDVSPGWYYFWLVVAILGVIGVKVENNG